MAVGRDMRLSSPEIAQAAIRGAADSGADVVDLGQIGTEMLYFAVGEYGYEGGLQVTASHNPAAYNGMKIVRRGALPVGGDTGLDQIKARALGGPPTPSATRGQVSNRDVYDEFHERALGLIDPDAVRPLNVVLDGANGMAGPMIAPILERLPVTVFPYSLEPDGHFPNHEPNPLLEENRAFIVGRRCAARRRPRDRLGRRCRSLLLHRRHGRVRARRPHHRAHRPVDAREAPRRRGSSTTCERRGRCATPSPRPEARRSRTGSATRSSRPASARRMPSSPARCPATTTSATSTTPTPGSCPALVMLELMSQAGQAALRAPRPVPRALPHLGRDQLDRGRCAGQAPAAEGALRPARRCASRTWTASRSSSTTGTSTCARRTPSPCSGSTWRPSTARRWRRAGTRCST